MNKVRDTQQEHKTKKRRQGTESWSLISSVPVDVAMALTK